MASRKRRSRGEKPERGEPAAGRRPATATATCPSCQVAVRPGDRFCHGCGAALSGQPRGKRLDKKTVALVAAGAVGAAVVTVAVGLLLGPFKPAPPPAPPPVAGSSTVLPGSAVDLSSMTPREAADRLFNRVMAASEQGDTAEALRFVPMALMAYDRVAELDADARYHIGRMRLLAGDIEEARKQIALLKQDDPDHLLALLLEHTIAEQQGDRDAAAAVRATFAAAYEAEMKTGRPEYEAHRVSLEKLRSAAGGAKSESWQPAASGTLSPAFAPPGPALSAAAQQGGALFAANCARCHGPNAAGGETGPPLVHKTYEPNHHGDEAFYRAVRLGVQSHHWTFGDMPPIAGLSDVEIGQIIAYVRALQVAEGIR